MIFTFLKLITFLSPHYISSTSFELHLIVCYYLLILFLMILIAAILEMCEMLSRNGSRSCFKKLILKETRHISILLHYIYRCNLNIYK